MTKSVKIPSRFLFAINYLVLLLLQIPMLQFRLSEDGYYRYFMTDPNGELQFARISNWLIAQFEGMLRINDIMHQQYILLVVIAIQALSVALLIRSLERISSEWTLKKLIFSNIALLFGIISFSTTEQAFFTECYKQWSFALLFAVLPCYILIRFPTVKGRIAAAAALFISLGFYQPYIGVYVIMITLLYLVKHDRKMSKVFWREIIWAAIVCVSAVAVHLLLLKILQAIGIAPITERDFSLRTVFYNLRRILVPANGNKRFIIIAAAIGLILLIAVSIKGISVKKTNSKYETFIVAAFVLLCIIATLAMDLVQEKMWFVPRTIPAYGFAIAALLIVTFEDIRFQKLWTWLCVIAFIANLYVFQSVIINQYALNGIDREYAQNIIMRIKDYETENDTQITSIAFIPDKDPTLGYSGVKYTYKDMNARAFAVRWSRIHVLNYYSGRQFQEIEPPEEAVELFYEKDWNYYKPEEQLVFDGDTVYIVLY